MREGGRPAGFKGGCTKRCVNEWKEVYLNPETGITTYTESGFGSRFGIPHYSSVFVGKIRISPCRPSSAPEHCGNRDIGFMDVSSPRLTFPGPQVSPSGEVKGERATNRGTRPLTRRAAQAGPGSEVFTRHEPRTTAFFPNHGHCGRSVLRGCARGGVTGNRRPDHCPRRQVTVFQFTMVHYCSPLFAKKILSCASPLVPPGRCFPARHGAAMARHGRPPSPEPLFAHGL